MKYANTVSEMLNVFENRPLKISELDEFYAKTMKVRTGDEYQSPILDIYDACETPSECNVFLLLGHRGCGKSTELNEMASWLEKDGYQVTSIPCGQDMDPNNPDFSDLLILMGDALQSIAQEQGCHVGEELRRTLAEFWDDTDVQTTRKIGASAEVTASIGAETPTLLEIIKMSLRAKSSLRFNEERRTVIRERVSNRLSDWTAAVNELADLITEKMEGRQPVLIFEDVDKWDAAAAWSAFGDHAGSLSAPTFPVIYTFPIALSYYPRFHEMEGSFQTKTFPMIKVERLEGGRCDEGYATITNIVEKRARLDLFEKDVLDYAIGKTGGSLRELFKVIMAAATRARRRRSATIDREDVRLALEDIKSRLTRTIERKNYAFLADIAKGNKTRIENRDMLLEMLQAGVVLEYNGERWHNVHPLVTEFLKEQGLVSNEG